MKKRAFTLLELVVSVTLLFLIVFFLASNYGALKTAVEQSERYEKREIFYNSLIRLFTKDILEAERITIKSGKTMDTVLIGKTLNSLYGRSEANVYYAVLKPSRKLIRIESQEEMPFPISITDSYKYDFLVIDREINNFKIHKSAGVKKCGILLFVDIENDDPIIMELGLLNDSSC
jgi:type II secretory pathway pseudopilin PulG